VRHFLIPAVLTLCAALFLPRAGAGYNWYYALVKARYPLTERTRSCVVCHTRAGSETLNRFGAEFLAAGADAGALALISGHDADGDGAGNEVELRTGHFPGEVADAPAAAEVTALKARRSVSGDLEREIFETLQCPCCDKLVMNCRCNMVPEIRGIVRAGVAAGKKAGAIKSELVARFGPRILPLGERSETLTAGRFADRRVANAYRIAADIPGELEKYPCFCPCYRMNGHLSLLDCYKNEHGARCTICIEEAEIIEAMVRDRSPEAKVRDRLVTQFGQRH
jgi:hypothetical protein